MKILLIDDESLRLSFAMRCQEAGHRVKVWFPLENKHPMYGKYKNTVGDGIVDKVPDWKSWMDWADLIVLGNNSFLGDKLEPYFKKGYPIFGCNKQAAELELDRELGQKTFEDAGIEVVPYKTFQDYDTAIAYIKKEKRPFVSKPWGGESDKSLSYVPKGSTPVEAAANLVSQLESWKRDGLKGEFMLQEMVEGEEMAVGGWFGPGGFSKWINENWEEKRLMNDGFGPNTGEMGTVMRYVTKSKLFDDVLEPVTDVLHKLNYVGYVDVNCIITKDGRPIPLEFTVRWGEPHYNLCQALHKGDPAQWMLDLLRGRDTLKCSTDICIGIVLAMRDYPWDNLPPEQSEGHPIRGITPRNRDSVYLTSVCMGIAPCEVKGAIKDAETFVTAGCYVMTVTGMGKTVMKAWESAETVAEEINWPPHMTRRTDIGWRLEKDIPELQKLGYAKGLDYGKPV